MTTSTRRFGTVPRNAAVGVLAALLLVGCTDEAPAPSAATSAVTEAPAETPTAPPSEVPADTAWPTAVDEAAARSGAEGELYGVWMTVAPTVSEAETVRLEELALELVGLGYTVTPTPLSCQAGATEQLGAGPDATGIVVFFTSQADADLLVQQYGEDTAGIVHGAVSC